MPKTVIRITAVLVCGLSALVLAALAVAQSPEIGSTQPQPVATPSPTSTPTPEELAAAEAQRKAQERAKKRKIRKLKKSIRHHRRITWYWQSVMQKKRTSRGVQLRYVKDIKRLKKFAKRWKKRSRHARHQAKHPPMLKAWLCIHSHEAPSWDSNTNPKYDGGLQMDDDFQWTYGRKLRLKKGPAYNWTPLEQIWVAIKAYFSGRGFYPWPNTARDCGLI